MSALAAFFTICSSGTQFSVMGLEEKELRNVAFHQIIFLSWYFPHYIRLLRNPSKPVGECPAEFLLTQCFPRL